VEGRREAEGRRPATGRRSTETVGLPDAARGRAAWRHDLLQGPDSTDRPPDDMQAVDTGPQHTEAAGATAGAVEDSVAAVVEDFAAAAAVVAGAAAAVDVVQTSC
jgi:hypothetical protein